LIVCSQAVADRCRPRRPSASLSLASTPRIDRQHAPAGHGVRIVDGDRRHVEILQLKRPDIGPIVRVDDPRLIERPRLPALVDRQRRMHNASGPSSGFAGC